MRTLYVMHVDWRWIKQRPHFLAEELSRSHDVRVLYRVHPRRHRLPRNPSDVRRWPLLPLPGASSALGRTLMPAQRAYIGAVANRTSAELVWVTFPALVDALPDDLHGARIVYDCMDDAPGFTADPATRARLLDQERRLCERADVVFCSSDYLARTLHERHRVRAHVVRNAVDERWLNAPPRDSTPSAKDTFDVAYIGTISEWFDAAAIKTALRAVPRLRIHLVGPEPQRRVDLDDRRIVRWGAVPHAELRERARQFDAFIMPFTLSPLIEAVDPVKLYEYMCFGRPVVSVRYPEIERFEPFVHFYDSHAELATLLEAGAGGTLAAKANAHVVAAFLRANTWSARAAQIADVLGGPP